MPWSGLRYPPAMRGLPPVLRDKAIGIANALLERGVDDGRAIRMAIAAAPRWGARRGVPVRATKRPLLAVERGRRRLVRLRDRRP